MITWWPALVALGVGVLAGIVAAMRLRGAKGAAEDQHTTLADLEERAAHAIQMLRDLDEQQPRMDAAAYQSERERLEVLAAQALRLRDERAAQPAAKGAAAKSAAKQAAPQRAPSQWRGFLWGAGTMAVVLFLYALVNQESAPRAPGGSLTGNAQSGSTAAPAPGGDDPHRLSPEVQALVDRLYQDPNDLQALHDLTRMMLQKGSFQQAKVLLERAETIAPNHLATRTYQAVLQAATGDTAGAATALDAVLQDDPNFADAWFFKGMVAMQTNNPKLTRTAWQKYVEVAPPGPQRDRIKAFLESGGIPAGGAPVHPPKDGAPAAEGDVNTLLDQARVALRQQNFPFAQQLITQIEKESPGHPVGRVYAAVLKAAGGDAAGAISAIDAVLAQEPQLADGWFFRGMLGMQSGQPELAKESWQKYVAVAPDGPQKERIKGMLQGLP